MVEIERKSIMNTVKYVVEIKKSRKTKKMCIWCNNSDIVKTNESDNLVKTPEKPSDKR